MQTVERPRFRQDLVAEAIEEGGQKFVDVGDPDNGTMFRFYEVEFSIACGMDGERDVPGLITWAKEELGLMPTAHEVRTVIAALGQYGFLDQGAAARAAATEHPAPAAAAAARDAELAAGVVVAQQQAKRPAPSIDVELGSAGTMTPASAQPLPPSADIALGAAGTTATAKPARVPVEDVALGAPGAAKSATKPAAAKGPDVSLDLADHVGVGPGDVKEAVRQSKQMSAVDVPKELLEQVEAPVPPSKVEAPKAKPAEPKRATPAPGVPVAASAAKPADAKPVESKPAEAKPVEKPAVAAEKKPAEKPAVAAEKKPAEKPAVVAEKKPAEKPAVVAEKKPIPPAPKSGVSPVLIILLVLVIGGAGAYFAWRYLIRGKSEQTSEVQPPPVTPASGSAVVAPTPPPPPPAPKGKIEIVPGAERDILSVFAGTIESIDTTERDVDTSDVIAKLVGAKKLEGQMAALDKEIERRKKTLDTAQANREKLSPSLPPAEGSAGSAAEGSAGSAGSASPAPAPPPPPAKQPSEAQLKAADAAIEKAQQALEDKQNERGKVEEELEKLYVRAPFEGKLTVLAKAGQKIEENTPVAKIVPKAAPTAKFKLDKNATLDRGLAVPLKVGEKMYTCEVADSNVDATVVVCRTNNEGLKEGDEATLMVELN